LFGNLELKMITLTILVFLLSISNSYQAFCKFLETGYFNLRTIDIPSPGYISLEIPDKAKTILFSFCDDLKRPKFCENGNVLITDSHGKCTSLATSQKGHDYNWERMLLGEENKKRRKLTPHIFQTAELLLNATIIYKTEVPNLIKDEIGIEYVEYQFHCPSNITSEEFFNTSISNKVAIMRYEGIGACGLSMIELTVFITRHNGVSFIVIFLAIASMVSGLKWRRLSLFFSAAQVGIFLAIIFLSDFENLKHLEGRYLYTFYACILLLGSVLGLFASYSLDSAIFLQCFTTSLTLTLFSSLLISSTLPSLPGTLFAPGTGRPLFWWLLCAFSLLLTLWTTSPLFSASRTFPYLLLLTQPFNIVLGIFCTLDEYPDLMSERVIWEVSGRRVAAKGGAAIAAALACWAVAVAVAVAARRSKRQIANGSERDSEVSDNLKL